MKHGPLFLVLTTFLCMAPLSAETCNTITFKSKKLPRECKRVSPCGLRTIFIPRSQGSNMARYLAGWKRFLPGCDNRVWGNISLALEYSRSRHGERLAQYLFGSTQLHFSGSQVANRAPDELLADDFGLPTTFRGSIAFKPRIDNTILDFNYQIGLDQWCYGLFFRFNAPVVISRWDLGVNCREVNNISSQQAPVFPACYMAKDAVPAALSIKQALSGSFIFGDMEQPLMFGAFPCDRQMKAGVADLEFILGVNFVQEERAHFGAYIIALGPTGNTPHSETVFEPIIGNGRLWEIGPGVTAHYDFFRNDCHILSFYLEGVLTTQFKKFQIRSFDLIGHGPLSRYMLLKEFDANNMYDGTVINAIDFTSRATRVGGSARFDLAAKLSYYYDRWGLDVGYNVYARSKEKLRIQDDLHPSDFNNRRFGIKGTEGVCFRVLDRATGEVAPGDRLNSTQHRATIFNGAPVDNPSPITLVPPNVAITWNSPTSGVLINAQQSNPPVIIDTDALDILSGAVPHQLTHKFFAHMSYTALDRVWEPQFGIGFEIETDGRSNILSSLNQWGLWFKGAVAF